MQLALVVYKRCTKKEAGPGSFTVCFFNVFCDVHPPVCYHFTPIEFSLLNVLDVLRTARFSSAKWRPLGLRLIPDPDLNAIQANNATVEERLEKVIDMWQRDGDKPSWETLAEAVSRCDGGGKNVGRRIQQQVGLLGRMYTIHS